MVGLAFFDVRPEPLPSAYAVFWWEEITALFPW